MFLIFGTKGVRSQKAAGQFICPRCRARRDYKLISVQRHGHVFFVPVAPMGKGTEYVECASCKGTFVPAVVAGEPANLNVLAEFEKAIVAIMIAVARADKNVKETEKTVIAAVYQQLSNRPLSEELFSLQLKRVKGWGFTVPHLVRDLRTRLNDEGRELVLRSAALVMISDGEMNDAETQLLHQIAGHLEMTRAHVRGVLLELGVTKWPVSV